MTEDELKAIEVLWAQEPKDGMTDMLHDVVPELVAEVRRLAALIKDAEWCGPGERVYSCPWCDTNYRPDEDRQPHRDWCPAFTPDGSVR